MLRFLQCSVISSVLKVYVLLVEPFPRRTKTQDIICCFGTHTKMGFSRSSNAALIWGVTFVSFTINVFICTVYFLLTIFLSCYYLDEFCTVLLLSTSGWCNQHWWNLFFLCNLGRWMFYLHFVVVDQNVSFSTSAALQDLWSLYIK